MHYFQPKFTKKSLFFTNLLLKYTFSENTKNVWETNNLAPLMSIFTQIDSISYSIITKWREKLFFLYQQGRQTNYKWHWANFWHEDSSKAPSQHRLSKIFPSFIFRLQGIFIVPFSVFLRADYLKNSQICTIFNQNIQKIIFFSQIC